MTRGVAITLIVLYHTLGYLQVTPTRGFHTGVDAFLLLSGFGLAYGTKPESWGRFVGRRLGRLLPAYWLVLALCVAYEFWRGAGVPTKQILLSATCLHVLAGPSHMFAINMSFWFLGLIVPLYLWFSLIRGSLVRGTGYAALGVSAVLAWGIGAYVIEHPDWWLERGHVPHRLPLLFVGAAFGVAFRRREPVERITREPALLLAACALVPVSVTFGWLDFAISLVAGLGVIALGMLVSASADRWRLARPASVGFAALGGLSYELFLCHQYLILTVGPVLLSPRLAERFPQLHPFGQRLMTACAMLATAVWVAWAVRWIVARRECRGSWRPTLATVALVSAGLIGVAAAVPAQVVKVRPRTFQILVELPPGPPVPATAEPIVYFGHHANAELVFLEHDGAGRARVGIDQWGYGPAVGPWADARELTARPLEVTIDARHTAVRAGGVAVASARPPYVPNAKPVVGRNDLGFSSVTTSPKSRVTRLRPETNPTTAPASR